MVLPIPASMANKVALGWFSAGLLTHIHALTHTHATFSTIVGLLRPYSVMHTNTYTVLLSTRWVYSQPGLNMLLLRDILTRTSQPTRVYRASAMQQKCDAAGRQVSGLMTFCSAWQLEQYSGSMVASGQASRAMWLKLVAWRVIWTLHTVPYISVWSFKH